MNKVYSRINWENYPSDTTPLNEENLNKMDFAVNEIDNRVVNMDTTKASVSSLNDLVNSWTMDDTTGIITITKVSGEQIIFDLNIEKIPVNFSMSDEGIVYMETDDGTIFKADIGSMIPILTFKDSEEIAVSVSGEGVNKTYSFSIKTGSIKSDKLQPDFLADVTLQANQSQENATKAQSYAVGGTGLREDEDTDNAKYFYERVKGFASGDTADSTVSFESGDSETSESWTDVSVMTSGEKHSALFNKISTMFKNVRYLFKMLGTTDISRIGGGTVTGATTTLKDLASKLWIIPNNERIVIFGIGEPDSEKYSPEEYYSYLDVASGKVYGEAYDLVYETYSWGLKTTLKSVSDSILSTVSECSASTTKTDIAGASAVAELNDSLNAAFPNYKYISTLDEIRGNISNKSYTFPQNGYVLVCSRIQSFSGVPFIRIQNASIKTIHESMLPKGVYQYVWSGMIPVKADTILTIYATTTNDSGEYTGDGINGVYFIPSL